MRKPMIGIHTLTAYPPANLNRDEDGRPKTAIVGGTERLRVSSQARKRPWRLSDEIANLDATLSTRTRELGIVIKDRMIQLGADKKLADSCAKKIAEQFGKVKKGLAHEENVVYGNEEWEAAMSLADLLANDGREANDHELETIARPTMSVDVAMFGRMRAAQPELSVDSAIAVSPLISTHSVSIEADNWTALDDLNPVGSAGMGEIEFASAVMYGYVCIDVESLAENLGGDKKLAVEAIKALMRVVALKGPQAMRSRFAQDALPELYRVEVGPAVYSHQSAFTEAVSGTNLLTDSLDRLGHYAAKTADAFQLGLQTWEVSAENNLDTVVNEALGHVFKE